jgi:hypothetical protein
VSSSSASSSSSSSSSRALALAGDGDKAEEVEHDEDARTLLMQHPRVAGPMLRDAATIAVRGKDGGQYRNPIQRLLYLS